MKIYSENFQKLIFLLPSLLAMSGQFRLTETGSDDVDVQILQSHTNRIQLRLDHRLATLDGSGIPDPVVTVIAEVHLPEVAGRDWAEANAFLQGLAYIANESAQLLTMIAPRWDAR